MQSQVCWNEFDALVVMWSRACPFSVLKTLHETASRRGFHTQLTKIPSQKNIQRSESPAQDFHKLLTCEPREVTEAPAEKGQQTRSVPWMSKSFLTNFKTYHMFELLESDFDFEVPWP